MAAATCESMRTDGLVMARAAMISDEASWLVCPLSTDSSTTHSLLLPHSATCGSVVKEKHPAREERQ
jgi:hypothetical protein